LRVKTTQYQHRHRDRIQALDGNVDTGTIANQPQCGLGIQVSRYVDLPRNMKPLLLGLCSPGDNFYGGFLQPDNRTYGQNSEQGQRRKIELAAFKKDKREQKKGKEVAEGKVGSGSQIIASGATGRFDFTQANTDSVSMGLYTATV
jgi:hypothetical protein